MKDVLTHEFSLDEIEKAILTVKKRKCGKIVIRID